MARFTQAEYNAYMARQSRPVESRHVGESDESKLHEQILNECRRRGWIAYHCRMDMPTTLMKGIPDFTIFADGGRVILVECKTAKGKLSVEQAAVNAWLSKLGQTVHVVRSLEEFMEVI